MAISQFPAPSAAGGGGAGLPIGATALEFGGKLTGAGYSHPGTLTAGKYIIEADNTVKVTLGDNAQELFVEPGETIDLAVDESNFFVEPKTVYAGPAQLVKTYPVPATEDTYSYNRYGQAHFNETTGNAAYWSGQYVSNTNARAYFRDPDSGAFRLFYSGTSQYNFPVYNTGPERAIVATNVDTEFFVISRSNSTRTYVYKCNGFDSKLSVTSLTAGTEITSNPTYGYAGAAISADGQTIVAPYANEGYALVSEDAGDTWTQVTTGVSAKDEQYKSQRIWWVHDRFIMSLSTSANFAHSTDGLNWTQVAIAGASGNIEKPARSSSGKWIFSAGGTANTIWTTTDLSSFSAQTVNHPNGNYAWDMGLSFGDGKFILSSAAYGYPVNMISEDDGATFFDISNSAAGYGNSLSGTNLWTYNSNAREISFYSGSYFMVVWWDALYEKWVMNNHPYYTSSGYWHRPFHSINTDNYLRWGWAVTSGSPNGSLPVYDEDSDISVYTANTSEHGRSNLAIEYNEATGDFKTLPLGFTGNGGDFSSTYESVKVAVRMTYPGAIGTSDLCMLFTTQGYFRTFDAPDTLIPDYTVEFSVNHGYNLRAWQWPDGSVNVFTSNTSTTYEKNYHIRKYNNSPTSNGITYSGWWWGSNSNNYEDEVFQWVNSLPWAPIVDEENKTFTAVYQNYALENASYPVTTSNLNANQRNNWYATGGDKGNGLEWQYWNVDSSPFKAGLNISENSGSSWTPVPAFRNWQYVYATKKIDGDVYMIVRKYGSNQYGVFKVNDWASGDYEELFEIGTADVFPRGWYATYDTNTNNGGGFYRPSFGSDLYLSKQNRLYKVFGSTSKPDTNLFVYNATNEVL